MSLQTNIQGGLTALATAVKAGRVMVTGSSTGTLASLTTTDKSSIINAINEVKASATGAPPSATETNVGVSELATQTETNTGTDDTRVITPLKLQTRLAAYAQPLAANLTTLAGVASTTIGRSLLGATDATAAKTALGLATVATTGSAADLTGVLGTAQLPPLAINDTFTVATQTAMLALTAQRGDVAIRTDLGRSFILSTDSPSTLADWKQLTAAGDVISVAGRSGAVVLAKADVGLSNVDNTSDASKPVSTAQAAADALALAKASNLSDLANVATARTNLAVYSTTEIGDVTFDFAAAVATALA